MTLSNEIRFNLLARRLERDNATTHDAGLSRAFNPRKVHVNLDNVWRERPVLFAFGAYGNTYVLAFGGLETALEDAAATLLEVAPGTFVEPDYDAARDEIMGETGCGDDMVSEDVVYERAEADLTYTESGWLPSWGWSIVGEGMSPEEIREWAANKH